jgi:hypothetical protein
MLQSVKSDWPSYLDLSGEIDTAWIEAFDRYYDTNKIAELIFEADPADYSNEFLILICQFGATLGYVMHQRQPRLQWVAAWPYWESSLYDPDTGNIIPPFHWAIKKFSSYGVDDDYAAKIDCMIAVLSQSEKSIYL